MAAETAVAFDPMWCPAHRAWHSYGYHLCPEWRAGYADDADDDQDDRANHAPGWWAP